MSKFRGQDKRNSTSFIISRKHESKLASGRLRRSHITLNRLPSFKFGMKSTLDKTSLEGTLLRTVNWLSFKRPLRLVRLRMTSLTTFMPLTEIHLRKEPSHWPTSATLHWVSSTRCHPSVVTGKTHSKLVVQILASASELSRLKQTRSESARRLPSASKSLNLISLTRTQPVKS